MDTAAEVSTGTAVAMGPFTTERSASVASSLNIDGEDLWPDVDSWFVSTERSASDKLAKVDVDSWFVSTERSAADELAKADVDSLFVSTERAALWTSLPSLPEAPLRKHAGHQRTAK